MCKTTLTLEDDVPDIDYCPNTLEDADTCSCGECTEDAEFFQPDLDY